MVGMRHFIVSLVMTITLIVIGIACFAHEMDLAGKLFLGAAALGLMTDFALAFNAMARRR